MFPAAKPEDSGQPGCTPAEKRRHSRLLESGGGLVDAYRRLNPVPAAGAGDAGTETEGMTWRGTAGKQVAAMGRYYGKVKCGMLGGGGLLRSMVLAHVVVS